VLSIKQMIKHGIELPTNPEAQDIKDALDAST
jgi:hypothetical protein